MLADPFIAAIAAAGAAVLVVTPSEGPVARARERARPRLGPFAGALDCLTCAAFWTGLAVGSATLNWSTPLAAPLLAWALLGVRRPG